MRGSMSFHVYIEPDLQIKLEALCRQLGEKRNKIVREALREYVEKRLPCSWPDEVFHFKADRNLEPFESRRADLTADRDNIFSGRKK